MSGCMVGPAYTEPRLPIQCEWLHQPDACLENPIEEEIKWWTVLQDPTLDSLIELAFINNKDLEASGTRVYQAYAALAISIGQIFPQFQQFQASDSYVKASGAIANPPPILSFKDYLVNFAASWEIDLWGKFRKGVLASEADLYGSIYTYDDVLRSLVGNISQLYMQIKGFNKKVVLLEKNVEDQEHTVKIVTTKQRLGETSGLDVQQALSVLEVTRASLELQKLQKELAENQLATLLGYAPFDIEQCYEISDKIPYPEVPPCVGVPLDMVRTRPDVRAAEEAAISQGNEVGIAQAELLPSFSLTGFFGWEAGRKGRLFKAGSESYGFSQDIAWNIFNYGRLTSNVKLQNAIFQERLVQYQRSVINAAREVEDAISSYLQNKKVVEDFSKAVQATTKTLSLSMVQYQYGAVEFLNVLTAETNLVQQQIQLVDAQVELVNSYISIQTSLGKGWQFAEGKDVLSPCTKEEIDKRIWWNKYLW